MTDDGLRTAYIRATDARQAADRATCPSADALLALVRRTGPESARLATLDHAMQCPACRQELELLRSIEAAGGAGTRDAVAQIRRRRTLTMALAASVVLAAGIGGSRLLRDRTEADVVRGETDALVLVAPRDGDMALARGAPITFAWQAAPGIRYYVVELHGRDGATAISEQTTDTTLTLRASPGLGAGDYRWWVRAQAADGTERRSAVRRFTIQAP